MATSTPSPPSTPIRRLTYWNPFKPEPVTSPREVREFETPMFAAFSNVVAELEEAILDGDRGAARIVVHAVYTATDARWRGPGDRQGDRATHRRIRPPRWRRPHRRAPSPLRRRRLHGAARPGMNACRVVACVAGARDG